MTKNDFYEILNKIRTENLFSSQAVELFSSCVGGKFEVELSFLQFTSVFGRQLDSKYDNGFKAVNGLSLKMYSDQIFCLLGHNGAGKTTTISMLTGLYQATEGQATIFGLNIFTQMDEVRK